MALSPIIPKWRSNRVDSELISDYNVHEFLSDVDGIIVPGGFGDRGIEGMICAIRYAREQKIPYLGLCLGMQLTIVEFARNVVGLEDAHSNEFSTKTTNPVIHIMPDKEGITNLGGTLRLGAYPCILADNSKALELYGSKTIERTSPPPLRGKQQVPGCSSGIRHASVRFFS